MRRWFVTGLLAIALVITGIWGYNQYIQNQDYRIRSDNLYQKSFYELVGRVQNIELGLSKMLVSGDQGQSMVLLSSVWRQADAAGSDLGQLPLNHLSLDKTSKFLNQLADYCYYLTRKIGEGKPLNLEEEKNLTELHNNCARINENLQVLENQVNQGAVSWGEIQNKGNKKMEQISKDIVTQQFTKIEQTSIQYPTLIYDGPFSETLLNPPKTTISGPTIDQARAGEIAADFLGRDRVKQISPSSEGKGNIETWGVSIEGKGNEGPFYVAVTKKGGKVIALVSEGGGQTSKINIEDAQKKAEQFLKDRGYPNMVPSYRQHYDGIGVFNFAFKDKNVIIYPDLIKVKVSLESGQVIGFEATNYLIAHKQRQLETPELSLDEAQKLVNPNLKISSGRLALIPDKAGKEILCYEFKGKLEEQNFIVYINANNGKEENILKIIDTENGTLAL